MVIWAFRPRIGLKTSGARAKSQEFSAERAIQSCQHLSPHWKRYAKPFAKFLSRDNLSRSILIVLSRFAKAAIPRVSIAALVAVKYPSLQVFHHLSNHRRPLK